MTAKCRRHGHVTLPSHSFVHSFVHSLIHSFTLYILSSLLVYTVCSSVVLIQSYAAFTTFTHVSVCFIPFVKVCCLLIALLSIDQTNIKLSILERLARFVRIKSCFHKDGTTGRMSQVAMTWSQTKSWLMAHDNVRLNICKHVQLSNVR